MTGIAVKGINSWGKLSRKAVFPVLTLFLMSFLSLPCEANKRRNLILNFHVNKKEVVSPSYCMAIWLEKKDGSYLRTLYASDWIAYGGYTVDGVCPEWVQKSDWTHNSIELPDAISGATPNAGPSEMRFDWNNKEIPPGTYIYRIEVHIEADYNEVYSGEIEFGKSPDTSRATVEYYPRKHGEVADLLSDVEVTFQ